MVPDVKMVSMAMSVNVQLVLRVCTVRRTQTSVPVTPVRMVPHVQTRLMVTSVLVLLDMLVSKLKSHNLLHRESLLHDQSNKFWQKPQI